MYTRREQAYGALSHMRECSRYFQGEVTSTDELHCVATAMETAWEDHGRHTSEGNMDLEVGFCFSLFNFSLFAKFSTLSLVNFYWENKPQFKNKK